MVQQAMQYIEETPDLETHIELIKTLNNVSAGKVKMFLQPSTIELLLSVYLLFCLIISMVMQIYVEIERARLTKKLAKIKEEQGLIAEAADLMQEIAVRAGLSLV